MPWSTGTGRELARHWSRRYPRIVALRLKDLSCLRACEHQIQQQSNKDCLNMYFRPDYWKSYNLALVSVLLLWSKSSQESALLYWFSETFDSAQATSFFHQFFGLLPSQKKGIQQGESNPSRKVHGSKTLCFHVFSESVLSVQFELNIFPIWLLFTVPEMCTSQSARRH